MRGPTSFRIKRPIGAFGWPASDRPISPPIEVPSRSTRSTFRRAIRLTASNEYWGSPYNIGSASQSLLPRPTTSGQTTR